MKTPKPFKWKKLGQIFNPEDYPQRPAWMNSHAQCTSVVVLEKAKVVRIFFSCRPAPDENGKYVSYTTFLDLERSAFAYFINHPRTFLPINRLSKSPILELGGKGCFDEFGIYPSSVIRDGKDLLCYYVGWQRGYSVPFDAAIGLAISKDDGLTWKKYGRGPIFAQATDEPYVLSGAKVRKYGGWYYLFYLSGRDWIPDKEEKMECVYKMRMAVSRDGLNWNRIGENILTDVLEENECQAGGDVFKYNGLYHMYFSYHYALDFRNRERGYRVGYAYSDDCRKWIRNDSMAGIQRSESGWDSEMMHYPHVFEMDGEWYMLYNGNDFGRHGFGIAKMEK